MSVKYKGEIFTKILAENQKNAGTISSLASGQFVKLTCDDTHRPPYCIYVHKTLLAAGSPMLKRLLQEDDSVCPHIIISGFDISIVEKFSRLLYHGCTKVDQGEIEIIDKVAELLGFPIPTLDKKATEDTLESASTALHYSRSKQVISGLSKAGYPKEYPTSASTTANATKALPLPVSSQISLKSPELKPSSSGSESGHASTNQAKPVKRRRKRKLLGTLSPEAHTSSEDDADPDFVPTSVKKVIKGRKRITSSTTSTDISPNPVWSKTSRMLRGSQNCGDLNPATDYWNRFIKCYFCFSLFSNEPSLLSHLTTSSCGKHLSGHLQFDTKFCNFCNKLTDSLTCFGYLKHLDTCYRKSMEEIRKLRGKSENGSSDETIPNRNFNKGSILEWSHCTPKEISSSNRNEKGSSDCDSDISLDAAPIKLKPLYIHPSAVLSVQQFRKIKKQYEVLTDIRRKRRELDFNTPFPISPVTKEKRRTQATSRIPLISNHIRVVEKIEIEEVVDDKIDDNMAELLSENDDDFVPPTISYVFSIEGTKNADAEANVHENENGVSKESTVETSTPVRTAASVDESRKTLEAKAAHVAKKPINPAAAKPENVCKASNQQSIHHLSPAISPPFEIISSDSEIEIVSEVASTTRKPEKQTSRAKKKVKNTWEHQQQSTWDSLLLEAVKRIISQNERAHVEKIHKTLRMLSLSESENYPIYPVFKRPSPFGKQLRIIQKDLDRAVRRKLLIESVKNGTKYYLPNGPHHSHSQSPSKFYDSRPRESAKLDQQTQNQPNLVATPTRESGGSEPATSNQNQSWNSARHVQQIAAAANERTAGQSQNQQDAATNACSRVERVEMVETVVSTLTIVHSDDPGASSGSASSPSSGSGYKCPNPDCGMTYQDPLKFETHLCLS